MKKGVLFLVSLLMIVSVALAGCSSDDANGSGSSKSKTVSVYTAFPEQEVAVYIEQFEKETGIDVKFVRLSAGETLARLQAEKENPQASVWFGGPSDTFVAAVNEGLLEEFQPKGADKLPEKFMDKKGVWTPI